MMALLERRCDYVRYIPFVAQATAAIDLAFSWWQESLPKSLCPYCRAYWRAAFTPILLIIQAALIL